MKEEISYNEEAWPLLVISFPKREATESDIHLYLNRLQSYLQKKEPVIVIIDMAEASLLPANLRLKINNWVVQNKDEIPKYICGTAYVVKNQIMRMALKAFLNFQNVSHILKPVEVFSSKEKAKQWALEKINKRVLN